MKYRSSLAMAALLLAATTTVHGQTIDTRTGESEGVVTTPNFGQTFTVPAGATFLLNYSFFFASNTVSGAGTTSTFRTYLRAVSGNDAVGEVLFSEEREAVLCCTRVEELFDVGAIPVVAGTQYVAFVLPVEGTVVASMVQQGGEFVNSYDGGARLQIQAEPECATTSDDCRIFPNVDRDFAFTANFSSRASVVPEPASLPLLLAGVAVLALVQRRGRRTSSSW